MIDHKPPKALDAIVDVVLAYRPKPKSKGAKKRKKALKKLAAKSSAKSAASPRSLDRK